MNAFPPVRKVSQHVQRRRSRLLPQMAPFGHSYCESATPVANLDWNWIATREASLCGGVNSTGALGCARERSQ
jgi:hypothetical protein